MREGGGGANAWLLGVRGRFATLAARLPSPPTRSEVSGRPPPHSPAMLDHGAGAGTTQSTRLRRPRPTRRRRGCRASRSRAQTAATDATPLAAQQTARCAWQAAARMPLDASWLANSVWWWWWGSGGESRRSFVSDCLDSKLTSADKRNVRRQRRRSSGSNCRRCWSESGEPLAPAATSDLLPRRRVVIVARLEGGAVRVRVRVGRPEVVARTTAGGNVWLEWETNLEMVDLL